MLYHGRPSRRDDMPETAEFSVENAFRYDRRSPVRWIWSHVWRYRRFLFAGLLGQLVSICLFSLAPVLVGRAVAIIMSPGPTATRDLSLTALAILIALLVDGVANM